jgi:zinc resistance-associated protein
MSVKNRTKKIIIAAAVTTALTFTGLQAATASPGETKGRGPGFQHPCPGQGQSFDEATQKARDTFLSETTELRKSMAEKRAAKRAVMNSTTPDPEKAAQLAGELFDLREQLRTKAKTAGLPAGMMMGMGKMNHGAMMPCNGQRMGGRHHGGNMM